MTYAEAYAERFCRREVQAAVAACWVRLSYSGTSSERLQVAFDGLAAALGQLDDQDRAAAERVRGVVLEQLVDQLDALLPGDER